MLNLANLWAGDASERREIPEQCVFGKRGPSPAFKGSVAPRGQNSIFCSKHLAFQQTGAEDNMGVSGCVTLGKLLNLSGFSSL